MVRYSDWREMMKTYPVTLPDEFAAFVDRVLSEGRWDSVGDLVMYGLMRTMEDLSLDEDEDLNSLRKALQIGIDQVERGEVVDGPTTMSRLREKLIAARKQPT
jgi:antitoxin ParD1/3/4